MPGIKKGTVSILCPSYNHELYVASFMDSVMAQTNQNWELVIIDDNSTDGNAEIIKKYTDPRIKLIEHKWNQGINAGLNHAFEVATGEFVSFCASDDMLCPDYVENVLKTFNEHPTTDIVYCDLQLIDNDNKVLRGEKWKNIVGTRFELVRRLFLRGNCMLSPGLAMRRNAMRALYPLPLAISQYQDYKMHIDLLLNFDFVIMDKICVWYRKPSMKSGISNWDVATLKIRDLEENTLMNTMLQIKTVRQLKQIFTPEQLEPFGQMTNKFIPYYLGMLALKYGETEYKQLWGYHTVAKFLDESNNYQEVQDKYGFNFKEYLGLVRYMGESGWFKKYQKYKKLFNIMLVLVLFFALTTSIYNFIA